MAGVLKFFVASLLLTGDVPSAVLLFEAGCQVEPENPEAWFLLGTSQVSINFLTIYCNISNFDSWNTNITFDFAHAPIGQK